MVPPFRTAIEALPNSMNPSTLFGICLTYQFYSGSHQTILLVKGRHLALERVKRQGWTLQIYSSSHQTVLFCRVRYWPLDQLNTTHSSKVGDCCDWSQRIVTLQAKVLSQRVKCDLETLFLTLWWGAFAQRVRILCDPSQQLPTFELFT